MDEDEKTPYHGLRTKHHDNECQCIISWRFRPLINGAEE